MNLEDLSLEELRRRVLANNPSLDIVDWESSDLINYIDEKNLKLAEGKPYHAWRTRYLKLQVVRRGMELPLDEDDRDLMIAHLNLADWEQEFT
jgi:hypothetical protein